MRQSHIKQRFMLLGACQEMLHDHSLLPHTITIFSRAHCPHHLLLLLPMAASDHKP
jgi:hypothetical protein